MTLLAPDGAVRQTDVRDIHTGRTRRYTGRRIDAHPADRRALRESGYTEASVTGATSKLVGFRCRTCGFGSFFRHCSRCGAECAREDSP